MRPLLAALLLAFFGVFSTARGDGSGPPPGAGTGCELCEGKGWLPCVHAWESLKGGSDPVVPGPRELDVGPLTVGTFLCSECLAMPCCQGLGWTPCPKCATKEIRDFREARLQECREVMERRRQDIDSRTGSKPLHLRSAHYELVWELPGDTVSVYVDNKERTYRDGFLYDEIPRARVNKRRAKISSHLRAHLYARRLEECWEQFSRTFDPDGQHPLWPPLSSDRWQDYVSRIPSWRPPSSRRAPRSGSGSSCSAPGSRGASRDWEGRRSSRT